MSQHVPIRVAISGGGMAGAALMHALHQEPNLDVHIFESASTFKEIGAAVGVLRNAKRALELIGPSAAQCLPRAGAVPMKAAHYMLARGPDSGEMVARIDSHGGDLNDNVHRAAFLRELLADVPPSQMHASKKLDTISRASDGSVVMHFADNTTHECDIVIGADGIHSRVRQLILGHDNPVASPVPAGWWFLQLLKPYKEVQALLGEELVDINNHVEYCYPGDGVFLLHNILSEGDLCQVAAVVKCDKDEAVGQWKKEVASKELLKHFSAFPPRHENAMKEASTSQCRRKASNNHSDHFLSYCAILPPLQPFTCGNTYTPTPMSTVQFASWAVSRTRMPNSLLHR